MRAAPSADVLTRLVSRALGTTPAAARAALRVAEPDELPQIAAWRRLELEGEMAWDDLAYLRWRYGVGATARGFGELLVIRNEAGPVGILGVERMAIRDGGDVLEAHRLQDVLVHRSLRDAGIGLWLNRMAFARAAVCMTIGGNRNSSAVIQSVFRVLPPRIAMMLPLDARGFVERRLPGRLLADGVGRVANIGVRAWTAAHRPAGARGLVVRPLERFDETTLAALRGPPKPDQVSMVRRADAMNWRLFENPRVRYVAFAAWRDDTCVGFAVASVARPSTGRPWLNLIDWKLAPARTNAALDALLISLAGVGRDAGCDRIQTHVSSAADRHRLERAGFLARPVAPYKHVGVRCEDPALEQRLADKTWSLTDLASDGDGY